MSLLQAPPDLGEFLSEASFWVPESFSDSAWTEHAPFAFWLMDVCRPRLFVELGTHFGFSYFAFNQALKRLKTKSRCFAIDTWRGDEHAGFYGEEVFEKLQRENAAQYGDFSELIRATFDEAVSSFEDRSIDVLHIDGRHFYEDVKHDFEIWRPKLSERGVVLLHDTNVRVRDFGVYRLWDELSAELPHFEFLTGHGLGVLCVGSDLPKVLLDLCAASRNRALEETIRAAYERLGRSLVQLNATSGQSPEQNARHDILTREFSELEQKYHHLEQANHALEQVNHSLQHDYRQLERIKEDRYRTLANRHLETKTAFSKSRSLFEASQSEAQRLQGQLEARNAESQRLRKDLADLSLREEKLRADLQFREFQVDAITSSHSWRVTTPLRAVASRLQGRPSPENNSPALLTAAANHVAVDRTIEGHREQPASSVMVAADRLSRPRVVFVSGEPHTPGHTYRIANIAECLAPEFFQVVVINVAELPGRLSEIAGANIVWIWRATWGEEIAALIAAARAASAKIVFDVDDLMFNPDLAVTELIDGIRSQHLTEETVRSFYEKVRLVLMHSDHCTTPTHPLAREARDFTKPVTVIPNGFNRDVLERSRFINEMSPAERGEGGLVRIGYAAGTLTHQKDLAVASEALASVLKNFSFVRLVLFRGTVELNEFPSLQAVSEQIEWRERVDIQDLPSEYARFDINIAPLEVGNRYCEAKSELKYFEAALVRVPTVASPTRPFADAIRDGETGLLARDEEEWYASLVRLIRDGEARERMARQAYKEVLWLYGPERRNLIATRLLNQLLAAPPLQASIFQIETHQGQSRPIPSVDAAEYDVIYRSPRIDTSRVSVVIPLFNYGHFLSEALNSLRKQTVRNIDVIVVDDRSTDNSLSVARELLERYAGDFNSVALLQNHKNSKLGKTRNTGVLYSDTELVFPLDPDNMLLPDCLEKCISALDETGAAFAYPTIETFGDYVGGRMGELEFNPALFPCGNYIDAMAMIRKACWIAVGGYSALEPVGWEDYDFWCKLVEQGMFGVRVKEVIAKYRVHGNSMLRTITELPENKPRVFLDLNTRHPWLRLRVPQAIARKADAGIRRLSDDPALVEPVSDELISILRCPNTGEPLHKISPDKLESKSAGSQWPIVQGRPVFTPEGRDITVHPESQVSNELSEEAVQIIKETKGLVLNLSAGGTTDLYPNVVELEYSIFCHTAVAGDVHRMPFQDGVFEAVICMNAFEHYREPDVAMDEVRRVLKSGGRFYMRTAFLQPLHEAPHHYYNCTEFGLRHWLRKFNVQTVRVSDNFNPVYAISWILSELQFSFNDMSKATAEVFENTRACDLAGFWRNPEARRGPVWDAFQSLPPHVQGRLAAGWEAVATKP